ncbi:MAG: DUF1206 domain-containing protein [Chloroflexi bacterium]|nr:DUF1206 domain-containing protein [Chloroflexota bacterium]OJV97184.1 MAG: hypothetical protein BGO39_18435 [Chloroflexi bacterium 54-19]
MLGRIGYAAKGVVYMVIGFLAALAAFGGGGGETTDRKGAVQKIYEQPFGVFLLAAIAFGLACYALWSFIMAAADTENKGTKPKGIATRLVYAGIGVSYLLFAFGAIQLLTGAGNMGKNSDASAKDWTAQLLSKPFGVALVIIAGLVVLGVAGWQFYKAYKAEFKKHLEMGEMSPQVQEWLVRFGRFGLAARGVVFGVMGIFLIVAALKNDPNQAKGLGGSLNELASQAYGQVLLGIVAIGLVAYGLYSLGEARYRRMVESTTK